MNFSDIPPKREVMGWNPQSLADYMRKLSLSGCDKAVMKSGISGAQFMQMTKSDLQVFPGLYVGVISKIQSEISKGEHKKTYGHKPNTPKFQQEAFAQEEEVWDSDEFDNESDHEDEDPHQERRRDTLKCAPELPDMDNIEEYSSDEYEVPSEDTVQPPQYPRAAKHQNWGQSNLPVDRSKKPGRSGSSDKDIKKPKGNPIKTFGSSFRKAPKPKQPKPTDVSNRLSKLSIFGPYMLFLFQCIQDLDPSWYGGQMTRNQAEAALRGVNKDGAFLVRNSSTSSGEHPYTLMLLRQNKIFNIKIRNQDNYYSLGTKLNNKSFPGVREMITHHTHTPLLLIDAKDQSLEAHSECCLLHPAGL
ncbi:lymphocyte cytosolic protein 2-like isoform X1 [Xyrichtys novacula]|uniref:Lymphocyte cytosolic protein 2-like isoform X1 n=1 Tax=Xyrichtys novacula TaxID=13765 RepID=A0AAV1FAP5_XYRNO|nr:lymphocyte cytosolic protein 2-like isoform X1 [Xyrichtys novacula]